MVDNDGGDCQKLPKFMCNKIPLPNNYISEYSTIVHPIKETTMKTPLPSFNFWDDNKVSSFQLGRSC